MVKTHDEAIQSLLKELILLKESPLYAFRVENNYLPVIGGGNTDADILFIGEAPGKKEAETGIPFSGAAGNVLNSLLQSIKLERNDIYITSIVNDRPPNNRDPKPTEIQLYSQFLMRLIDIIRPTVIVTLGRFSMHFLLDKYNAEEKDLTIKELHGKVISVKANYGSICIVPLYHPAFALYNASMKKVLLEDIQILKQFIPN